MTTTHHLKKLSISLPVLAFFMLTGCASVNKEPVQANVTRAQMAVQEADRYNARDHAALELRVAQEKLGQAKAALENGDYRRADWLAEEALVNTQLAEAKTRSVKNQNAVAELRQSIDILKRETGRLQE